MRRNDGFSVNAIANKRRKYTIAVMHARFVRDFLTIGATRRIVETVETARVQCVDFGAVNNADNAKGCFHDRELLGVASGN